MTENSESVLMLVLWLAIYFLPVTVAALRRHHQTAAIFILDFFLAWTLLFWVLCLAWAFTAVRRKRDDAHA